jgi:CO/xanthine dehydrogenase Mo-binding subunit
MLEHTIDRRSFLKLSGFLVVTFSLRGGLDSAPAYAAPTGKALSLTDVASFIAIAGDGNVTIYCGHVDLGTGVQTAIGQIAAEELDVPFDRVTVIQGDTALTPDQGITYGSLSIQLAGMQIRQAAATAREALLVKAADRLASPLGDLVTADGLVSSKTSGKKIGYGDLIAGTKVSLTVDKQARVKAPADYTIVGKSIARVDIPDKATAKFTYAQDVVLPGMLYGRAVFPPAMEAKIVSIDEASLNGIPGIVKVVHEGNFCGVVAKTEWAAIKAARQLKVTWTPWAGLPEESDLWSYVRASKVAKDEVTSDAGNTSEALASAARRLKATYDFAPQTHGSIGPSAAVAEFKDGKLTCWTASQATHALRKQLARMLSLSDRDVRCIYVEGAGCYGRNGHEDAAGCAAFMAHAVRQPVRVQWMRWDEHGWDPKGPPTLIDLEAGIDANGNVIAWKGDFFIPAGAGAPVWLLTAQLAGLPHHQDLEPGNIVRNSDIPYDFPNRYTVCHRLASTPFRPSWIRSPGRMQNTFANEAFLDEIVASIGADPLEYRLQHIHDERGKDLLQRLGKLAKWKPGNTGDRGRGGSVMRGRGLCYVHYELVRTYVGIVVDVEVERSSGKTRVTRATVVHDCGQIINPDGVRNQIEGGVIQTISRTLLEELKFNRSRVTSLDWATYPILTFPDVPDDVVIELVDRPSEVPWGAGEPTCAVVPAAISNAIFDATGARLRSVPFKPDKVKAALARV